MKRKMIIFLTCLWLLNCVGLQCSDIQLATEALFKAIEKGNLEDMDKALQNGALLTDRWYQHLEKYYFSIMHWSGDCVRLQTPLMRAISLKNKEAVKLLLQRIKSDPDILEQESYGLTPLMVSIDVDFCDPEIVLLLVQNKANLFARGADKFISSRSPEVTFFELLQQRIITSKRLNYSLENYRMTVNSLKDYCVEKDFRDAITSLDNIRF